MKKSVYHFVIILTIIIVFSSLNLSAQLSVIQTENGQVSGYKSGDITIFKGVPFAAPPIGDLRWKAPQPVKNWTGTLNVINFQPARCRATQSLS
jgi:para-nitrobenzyl esterase